MKYLLTIAYDGRRYHGYQIQKNGLSIQQMLCEAAEAVFHAPCAITGCSRTDSGVHALDFKATLEPSCDIRIPAEKVAVAMNTVLPEDISVLSSVVVPTEFHARYDVKWKEYRYQLYVSAARDPFLSGRAYHYPRALSIDAMAEAATHVVGTHDFRAFMASGSDVTDTVRTIYDCHLEVDKSRISIVVSGNGFLYNMVRILTGTLLSVAEGKRSPEDVPRIITSCDRTQAGITVPPHGLYLSRVSYDEWRESHG